METRERAAITALKWTWAPAIALWLAWGTAIWIGPGTPLGGILGLISFGLLVLAGARTARIHR